jgi:ABC-2 type transport system ATP-binding protein
MRGELAATLIHRPRVLFLDEPTIGVDVVGKAALRQFIREINRSEGVTVMLTSHDLGDIESVCQRVLLLHRGRLVGDGTPQEITRSLGAGSVLFVQLPPDRPELAAEVQPLVPEGCSVDVRPNNGIAIAFDRSTITPPQILARLASVPIVDLRIEEASLADAFVKVYGHG